MYILLYLYLYYRVYKLIQNFFQYKADNFQQAVVIMYKTFHGLFKISN